MLELYRSPTRNQMTHNLHHTPPNKAEFLHQERVDEAVKSAIPLDSDDLDFLKSHANQLAMSLELLYSDGGWWLPKSNGTGYLTDALLKNRRARS